MGSSGINVRYMSKKAEFACKAGSEATCDTSTNCRAEALRIHGAFLITDEDQGRSNNPAWEACGFVRMIEGGVTQEYDMDYACGCDGGEDEYLSQDHSPDTASC